MKQFIQKIRNRFLSQPVYTIHNMRGEVVFKTTDKTRAVDYMLSMVRSCRDYLCLVDDDSGKALLEFDGFRREFF